MLEFTSEDDLKTFDGWLKYQGIDAALSTVQELENWRRVYQETRERSPTGPIGRMKLRLVRGEHRYAVAVRDGSHLYLTLWVRRSLKGEFFVFLPRADGHWNPHPSYHRDGTLHMKSHDHKVVRTKRQPLKGRFCGTERLGFYGGHAPKSVGAICNPADFSGIVEVPPGVLGPCNGTVLVDLVEPGCKPTTFVCTEIVQREIFDDIVPHVVITICS